MSEKGFSLIEMLVSMFCVVIIMVSVYDVFSRQSGINTVEQGILDLQLNSRIAIDRLDFLFSHAGFGCADSFADGDSLQGEDDVGDSVVIENAISTIVDSNASAGGIL